MSFKDGMKPITSDEIKNLRYAVQYFQDCYLVSSVSSLTKTSNGRRILTENIAHTDDGYRIRFQNVKGKCQDYFVSQKEIDLLTYLDKYGNTIIIPEDKPHNQIIKAIETAMNKLLRRYPDKKSFLCRIPNCNEKFEFNKPSVFLEMFTGKKPIKLNEDGLSLNLKSKKTECIDLFEKISKEPLIYHSAFKKNSYIDENGKEIIPAEPNAFKFESFIFDAFEFFDDIAILRGKREDDFAPVKNRTGEDSPRTAKELYEKFWNR